MNKIINIVFLFLFVFTAISNKLPAQSTNVPLNKDYYHLIERYEILYGKFAPQFHTVVKPIQRQHIAAFTDSLLDGQLENPSKTDIFNLRYLSNDNWIWSNHNFNESKKPIFKIFYRKKSDLYHVDIKNFDLHVNPVLYLSGGKESASNVTTYTNTRGIELRGNIARKLGFYSYITATQATNPLYVRDWIKRNSVVPGEGFWKSFKENGVDYYTAKAYISFDLLKNYINTQFGFDNNFFGTGYRSLELSNFSPGYTFLKFNTKVWRINYTNIFAQVVADAFGNSSGSIGGSYPVKFMAAHHLSFNITKNLNIGFSETVIMGDSTGSTFNIGYLNPIIFYRAFEHQQGSQDNVIINMDFKWNFANHFSIYGQFTLDEFLLSEIRSGNGWWGNKWGGQAGIKYINVFGLPNLDVQLEYNIVRPYTYAHLDVYTNVAHYRQPLAHPLGANFKELVSIIRYQPTGRLSITAQLNLTTYGEDSTGSNWGKNVMLSYTTREQNYDNKIGQGVNTKLIYGDLILTYQLAHNMFFDLRYVYRKLNSELNSRNRLTNWYSLSMRWNIARTTHDF